MSLPPSETELSAAAEALRRGGLVAFPTETVYGLGANAFDSDAVAGIYRAKNRPFASPLIVHVATVEMARSIVSEWPESADRIAARFWPGPVTLVLPKSALIPDIVTAGLNTVGIRIPNHPVALALLRQAGVPVAAPSANRFGAISPTNAGHVGQSFPESVVILDGGPSAVGIESTVVALHRHPPEILRPGMVTERELESVTGLRFGQQSLRPELVDHLGDESPGQQERHYAPRTPFYVLKPGQPLPEGKGQVLDLPKEPAGFAQSLYGELHRADAENWSWIAVAAPPDGPDWDGIWDRLRRASAKA